jgi:flagellar FliJ protein
MAPVQQIAGKRAQDAARHYAARREALEQEQERLAQLRGFRREYEQKLSVTGEAGIDGYRLQDYQVFLGRIDRAIGEQANSVEQLQAEVQRLRDHWLQEWGNARALEQLVERYKKEERRAGEAREQKMYDELAQHRQSGGFPGGEK